MKNSMLNTPPPLKERESNYNVNTSSNETKYSKHPRWSSNVSAELKEAVKNKTKTNSEFTLADSNTAYSYAKIREVSSIRNSVEDNFTTTSTQQLKTSRVTLKSSQNTETNKLDESFRLNEENNLQKSPNKRPTKISTSMHNANGRYEEVPHDNKLFKRLYDKYSDRVEKTLQHKGKDEIDLIGNHRFKSEILKTSWKKKTTFTTNLTLNTNKT